MIQIIKHSDNPSHKKHLSRLNRIAGQIEGIKKMIQENRYCPDILNQLHAARSAIRNLEIQILDKHCSHCVAEVFKQDDQIKQKEKIEEIGKLIKQLSN